MDTQDIRWKQRLVNFGKALEKLNEGVSKLGNKSTSLASEHNEFLEEIAKEGVIQRFEYTHELAWNVMKDFFASQGLTQIYGSKDATREAFSADLITDGEVWMDMIVSRNKTSHLYNEATAHEIFSKIVSQYHDQLNRFYEKMKELALER